MKNVKIYIKIEFGKAFFFAYLANIVILRFLGNSSPQSRKERKGLSFQLSLRGWKEK